MWWSLRKKGAKSPNRFILVRGRRHILDCITKSSAEGSCPICESQTARHLGRSLFFCLDCRVAYNSAHKLPAYNDSYFQEEYRAQYGKTYLDDFEQIYASSRRRIELIFSLIKKDADPAGLSLLDIGSAMGFFLKAALDRGIRKVSGIEISRYAAEYCKNDLGIDVENRPLMPDGVASEYDIITAWFFIEHCADPCGVIMDIASKIRPGGVFAFSVPSVFGPLYFFNRKKWVKTHPDDHRVDFTPARLRVLLNMAGFTKIRTVPAGFHPERILDEKSLFFGAFSSIYRIVSRMLSFSDTLEVYALKENA